MWLPLCWFYLIIMVAFSLSLAILMTSEEFRSVSKLWRRNVCTSLFEKRWEAHKSVWFVQSGFRSPLQLIQVCSENMLWFAKLSGQFSDGFIVVVPILKVSTYGIFCHLRYEVLEIGHFFSIWEATVVVNGCFEESEPLVPFQRITCEIINWYLRQTYCMFYCLQTSELGFASSLVEDSGNTGSHCIGCRYRRCYSVHLVRYNFSVVVDCFVVCTYGSWSTQLGYCFEKTLVVETSLLCYPLSHVRSVHEHGSLLSIDLNSISVHLFSVPLWEILCSFLSLQYSERVENHQGLPSRTSQR